MITKREIALRELTDGTAHIYIKYWSKELLLDRTLIIAAIKETPENFIYIPQELRDDNEIVSVFYDSCAKTGCENELLNRTEREIVLDSVRDNPFAMKNAGMSRRDGSA